MKPASGPSAASRSAARSGNPRPVSDARERRRVGPSSSSPASETPPPMMMQLGSKAAVMPARPTPSQLPIVGEQLDGERVAVPGGLGDQRAGQPRGVAVHQGAQVVRHGDPRATSSRASRTSALPEAYCSQQPAVAALAAVAVRDDLHVPELAGHPVGAAEHPAVDHQRAADAGAERDAEDEAVPDAGTEPALRERRGVGVVVDHHGETDSGHQRVAQRLVAPVEVRGEHHHGERVASTNPAAPMPTAAISYLRAKASTRSTMVSSTSWTSCPRVGTSVEIDDRASGVDDAAEHLGATDVDADRQRVPP